MSQKLTIDQSFQKILKNLNPTEKQRQDIQTKRDAIDRALAKHPRIFLYTKKQQSFLTGSYSRGTIIRPIHDVDLYVRVHYGKHAKDKSPRSILSLMATALRKRYPGNTSINVDSPCIIVSFSGYKFEVVPVVGYENNSDLYDIPAPGSQLWMQCYPHIPSRWISSCNHRNNKMFIPMIKLLKQWNRSNKVNLKSFHIELLTAKVFGSVTEIYSYPQGILDWMYCVRDWFWRNSYPFIEEPGHQYKFVDDYVYEKLFRLRVIRNKVESGLKKAERAYALFMKGRYGSANRIWRNMFGAMFPSPEPVPSKPVFVPPKPRSIIPLRDLVPPPKPQSIHSLGDLVPLPKPPTTGFLGGAHRNAIVDVLFNSPPPKPSGIPVLDNNRGSLTRIGTLSGSPSKLSNIDRKLILGLLGDPKDPYKKY